PALAEGTDADVADLAAIINRLKPLAQLAVDAHLARAMERRVRDALQAHVEATGMSLDGPAATA
ncbi:MAG: MerR family transcriptional regulator, partial [Actinomycetota bacterium]|nr:MerR family transcriptional regulator [Actinomycetota bacterium]